MTPKYLAPALLSGLLSSGLFLLVFGANLGFVFMFLPTLPLFFLGLSPRAGGMSVAVIAATFLVGIAGGIASAILFLVFLGLPAWYFAKKSLLFMPATGEVETAWYPIGAIITGLSLYGCCLIALITWYYSDVPGGLPQMLSQNIHEAFSDLEGDYGDIIDEMAGGWSFLMFPITLWLWGILLYAHAWIANRALQAQQKNRRTDFSIALFTIPGWMLHLVAICALATLIGSPSMSFLGKSALLTLTLPYFFLGCALMHNHAKRWPQSPVSNRFFIFFVYFLVFTQFWPVLILAGLGLTHQIKCLSADNSWFKS